MSNIVTRSVDIANRYSILGCDDLTVDIVVNTPKLDFRRVAAVTQHSPSSCTKYTVHIQEVVLKDTEVQDLGGPYPVIDYDVDISDVETMLQVEKTDAQKKVRRNKSHLGQRKIRKYAFDTTFADVDVDYLVNRQLQIDCRLPAILTQSGDSLDQPDLVLSDDEVKSVIGSDTSTDVDVRMNAIFNADASYASMSSFKTVLLDALDAVDCILDDKAKLYLGLTENILLFCWLDLPNIKSMSTLVIYLYRLAKECTGYSVVDNIHTWLGDVIMSYEGIATQGGYDILDYVGKFTKGKLFNYLQKTLCAIASVLLLKNIKFPSTEGTEADLFKTLWKAFSSRLTKQFSGDIVETVLEFCKWISTRGYELICGDSTFKSIFFEEEAAHKFDERIAQLDFMYEALDTGIEEAKLETYMQEVVSLEAICHQEFNAAENKSLKVALQRQLMLILKHKGQMLRMYKSEANRPKPFAILLSGTTAVGKTVMSSQMIPMLQRALKVLQGPEYVFNFDTNDKYMSGVTYAHNTISLDDLGNTELAYVDKVASDFVIYLINNFRRYAVMADVDSKGKIPIRPALVVATTNDPELKCTVTSVEPLSIMGRFDYHIQILVKECCGEGPEGKRTFKKEGHNPIDHNYDCWEINVFTYVPSPETTVKMIRQPVPGMTGVGFAKLMEFLVVKSSEHVDRQAALVRQMQQVHKQEYCEHNIFRYMCLRCKSKREEIESLNAANIVANNRAEIEAAVSSLPLQYTINTMGGNGLDRARKEFMWNVGHQSDRFAAWCKANSAAPVQPIKEPASYNLNLAAKMIMGFSIWNRQKIARWQTFSMACIGCMMAPLASAGASVFALGATLTMLSFFCTTSVCRIYACSRVKLMDNMTKVVKDIRRDWRRSISSMTPVFLVVGITVCAYKLWRASHKLETQGCRVSLPVPNNVSQRRDPYRPPNIEVPEINLDTKTATCDQIVGVIQRKLVILRFRKDGKFHEHCVSVPICTGFFTAPYHILQKQYDDMQVILGDTIVVNNVREVKLPGTWKRVGTTDTCLIYIPIMGDQRDLRKLFPDGDGYKSKGIGCKCVWAKASPAKSEDGDTNYIGVERGVFNTHFKTTMVKPHNLHFEYPGGEYQSALETWEGMCGSVMITDRNGPTIVGVHSAGAAGTKEARTCTLLRKDIDRCIEEMTGSDSAKLLGVQSGNFAECLDFEGTNFRYINRQRPKATTTFVDCGEFKVLGSFTAPHRNFRSSVRNTAICEDVMSIMGYDLIHGAPRYMGDWSPWNAWVTAMSKPCDMPMELLDLSYNDFKRKIISNWQPDWKDRVHPLHEDAILAGIDGLRGCYAMNMNTSMGIPYCKPKKNFLPLSTRIVENISCPRDLPDNLRKEIDDMESALLSGKRVYSVARCTLKDEPTLLTKTKVRVFMGTPFAYQFLMRKYFLMLCVIIQEHPQIFENAIGTNAESVQWTELYDYIAKFGRTRAIAGDFQAYDQKMDVKISFAFFKILIWMAAECGFTQDQQDIMTGLATETCMFTFDVCNEILMFGGGVSSGNNITEILNSGDNRLLMGGAFYALRPPNVKGDFSKHVALMTYGDDNTMTVREGSGWFNHTSIASVFYTWGLVYTMADKDAHSVPYIHMEDVEFLKRKWVWSDEYKRFLCPLAEKSIQKSLMCAKQSDVITPAVHSAQVILGANREYWQHGKEVFQYRHAQLKEILEKNDITHHLPGGVLPDYEGVARWYMES